METLALEITRALQFFFTSTSHSQVDQIVLSGGCAVLPGPRRTGGEARGRRHGDGQSVRQHGGLGPDPAAPACAGRADAADRDRPGAAELRVMSSIRINLLPHREQKRQARQRQFYHADDFAGDPGARRDRARARHPRRADREPGGAQSRCSRPRSRSSTNRSRKSTGCATRSRRCWRASRWLKRCRATAARPCTCSTSSCASCRTASTCAASARPVRE